MVGGTQSAPGTMVGGGAMRAQHPAEERGRALRGWAAENETASLPMGTGSEAEWRAD